MTERHQFTIDLSCEKCCTTGVAQVSHFDTHQTGSADFKIDDCPGGFRVTKEADTLQHTCIICELCGTLVHGT